MLHYIVLLLIGFLLGCSAMYLYVYWRAGKVWIFGGMIQNKLKPDFSSDKPEPPPIERDMQKRRREEHRKEEEGN
jgi:hypothetical protein